MSFGVSDAMYGEEVNAAVILRPGQTATEEELEQYCPARLSAFEVPKRFFFMTSFPPTVKGADDRHRLAAALGLPSQRGLSWACRWPPERRRGPSRVDRYADSSSGLLEATGKPTREMASLPSSSLSPGAAQVRLRLRGQRPTQPGYLPAPGLVTC